MLNDYTRGFRTVWAVLTGFQYMQYLIWTAGVTMYFQNRPPQNTALNRLSLKGWFAFDKYKTDKYIGFISPVYILIWAQIVWLKKYINTYILCQWFYYSDSTKTLVDFNLRKWFCCQLVSALWTLNVHS